MVGIVNSFSVAVPVLYVGPGDVVTGATAWYGVRAYNNSYAAAAGNAFDLRRSSDNGTMTAVYLTTGDLDTATISAWAGADNIFVSKAYDSTGNARHATQATAGDQPRLFLSGGPNNRPYLSADFNQSASIVLNGPNFSAPTGLATFSAVANRSAGTGICVPIASNGTSRQRIETTSGSSTQWRLGGSAGGLNGTAANAAWHAAVGVVNGASSILNIDGTETTGTVVGATTSLSTILFIKNIASTTILQCEGGFFDNLGFSSGDRTALRNNQAAYYGL